MIVPIPWELKLTGIQSLPLLLLRSRCKMCLFFFPQKFIHLYKVSSKYTRQFLQVFLPVETPYKKNVQMVNNNLMGLRLKSHVVHKGVINKDSYFNHQFESNMQLNQIKKCREVCHKWIKCHKKCNITKMLFCHLILLLYFWEIKKFNQLRAILHEWKIIESRGGGGGEGRSTFFVLLSIFSTCSLKTY